MERTSTGRPRAIGAILLALACVLLLADRSAGQRVSGIGAGAEWASEKRTWIDDTTGCEITQWTSTGKNSHPYFTTESFINETTAVIFSDRSGRTQLYKLDLDSGRMIQMTDAKNLRGSVAHLPGRQRLWYFDGSVLCELNTETLVSRAVYDFERSFTVISFSVSCDARWFIFSAEQSRGRSGTCGYGPYAVYKLNLQDTSVVKITPDYGFNIGHVQANPADPDLVLYCWQWEALGRAKLVGLSPIRIWWVNINGTDGGPLAQPFGLHRTHEAWTPDGKYVTYSGDFRFGPQKGREVLGFQSLDGRTNVMYDARVWHAHQTMFKDNRHWVADLNDHDDRMLMLFERGEGTMQRTTPLFRHASSWEGQSSHPHPRFSPGGRCILFSTDRTGAAQVYTVRIDLDNSPVSDAGAAKVHNEQTGRSDDALEGSAAEAVSVSAVGTRIPSEQKTWIDDTTGCEITQWTSTGENSHPYFTTESFIDDTTALIFSKRTGRRQLYRLDLATGVMVQMTAAQNLRGIDHLPKLHTVWYMDGTKLVALDTRTFHSEELFDFAGAKLHVGSFTVTCDGQWFVFSALKKESAPDDPEYGPYALYRFGLRDKSLKQITLDYGFNIGHVQANPVDPTLIMYCWQWEKPGRPRLVGHSPSRIWWVRIDGSDGGPLAQEFGTQRTHETWSADGKFISFVSKYRMGPQTGRHFLGIQTIGDRVRERYFAQVSPGHQNLFKDNRHWIVDEVNNDDQLLALLTRGKGGISGTKILFRHGSSMTGQGSHPHPRFSTEGTYVLFSTDRTGSPQVYTVRTGLGKK